MSLVDMTWKDRNTGVPITFPHRFVNEGDGTYAFLQAETTASNTGGTISGVATVADIGNGNNAGAGLFLVLASGSVLFDFVKLTPGANPFSLTANDEVAYFGLAGRSYADADVPSVSEPYFVYAPVDVTVAVDSEPEPPGGSSIIFEPFDAGIDTEATIEAAAPRATALFMLGAGALPVPGADAILLAVAPAATSEITGHQVGMVMPSVTTVYALVPAAIADLLGGTSGALDTYAPRATALLTPWASMALAEAPEAYANLVQINPDAGYVAAYSTTEPYVSIWSGHWGVDLAETVTTADATASDFIIQLRERLGIVGTTHSILHTAINLQDTLVLRDAVQIIWHVVLNEAMVLADSCESQRVLVTNLIDRLVLADIATTTLDARVTLATVLALADDVSVAWLADLVEALEVSDTLDARITALVEMLERLETADAVTQSLTVLANVSESLLLADEGAATLDASVALHEALEMFGSIVINGETWSCWLINTESKGVARYTNYPFNSFAKAPWGGYVGATDTGLHMLDGDTDDGDPIPALIRSALTDFGSRHLKRVPNMYLGYTATGPMVLKVVHTSEQGRKVEDWYRVEPREADSVRESRFKVGRGVASVYLGFELVNIGGADFALDVVEWLPLRLDRRVR